MIATPRPLPDSFFDRDAQVLARALLGKIIRHRHQGHWLAVRIIETEAYYLAEKGSHASLGYTEKRRALFLDGVALDFKSNDMWWAGNYNNGSQFLSGSSALSAGNHTLSIYGLEGCCDGGETALCVRPCWRVLRAHQRPSHGK